MPTDDRFPKHFNSLARVPLWALVAYAVVRSVVAALHRPFWYDELCTLIIAHQPGSAAIWHAIAHAADGQPPLYYILERGISAVFTNEQLGLRALSIVGFCLTILCVFVFVERRSGGVAALACACIPFLTVLLFPYAVEARPYAFLVGCIALACVCYQRATSRAWVVLLAVSLALAQGVHYYGVLAIIAFGLAEIAYCVRNRNVRSGVWIAYAIGLAPLAIYWPLLQQFKVVYGSHYWAEPLFLTAVGSYGFYWNISPLIGLLIAFGALVGSAFIRQPLTVANAVSIRVENSLIGEKVLIIALLLLPVIGFIVTGAAKGGFTYRYVLPGILGFPLTVGYVIRPLSRRITGSIALLLLAVVAYRESTLWRDQGSQLRGVQRPTAALEGLLGAAANSTLPIAVADARDYLVFAYYASPGLSSRLVYLADPRASVAFIRTDSGDRQLLLLQHYYALRIRDIDAFSNRIPSYLVFSRDKSKGQWLPAKLAHDGTILRTLARDSASTIYGVNLKPLGVIAEPSISHSDQR